MANFSVAKNNFTSGELDPKMHARNDVAQYANGLETCENFQIMTFGGIKKRNGTKYVAGVKTNSKKVRLVRFEFNVEQAYILEFGNLYLRFYKDQGQITAASVPYEIVTTYLEADLFQLKFTQSADILYISHPDYKPRKLSRTGHTAWTIVDISFENGPFLPDNITTTTIKSSAVNGNVTLTASTAIFDLLHVGSVWKLTRGVLGSIVDASLEVLDATTDSISLAGSTVSYRSEGTWVGQITIERSFDNGTSWSGFETFSTNDSREYTDIRDVLFRAKMTQYTSGIATVRLSQLATNTEGFGSVLITGFTSTTIVSATVLETLSEETIGDSEEHIINGDFDTDISDWNDVSTGTGASIAWNVGQFMDLIGSASGVSWAEQQVTGILDIAINHFLSFDVGVGAIDLRIGTTTSGAEVLTDTSYAIGSHSVSFLPGASTVYIQFKHSVNATHTLDNVAMDSILADSDQTTFWAEGAWSYLKGWPRSIGFYDQRLDFASTDHLPTEVWGSVIGDFENFKSGVDDDESFNYALNSEGVNIVYWLVPWKILALGTAGSEWRMSGSSVNTTITPTNVIAKSETKEGSADIQAIQVQKSILFVDRTEKNIREFTFSFNEDAYSAPVLNQLAKHLTRSTTIVDYAYQKDPDSIVWFILASGDMMGLTYNPAQKIVAFYQFKTDGYVESVAVIPGANGNDEVWVSVKRNINGSDVRYVEFLNEPISEAIEDAFYVDSGISYSGAPANIMSGLDHLEGETVDTLGDGQIMPQKIVTAGSITLPGSVSTAHIGLPFTATARTMPFTEGARDGSGQGRLKQVNDLVFDLYKSIVMKYGKDSDNLRELFFSKTLGVPGLFTGLKDGLFDGEIDAEQQITVVSDKPTPLTLLAIDARGQTSGS